jgi:hypothetical protein
MKRLFYFEAWEINQTFRGLEEVEQEQLLKVQV